MILEAETFEILIRRGTLECRVPLLALAAALRLPRDTLSRALEGLLLASVTTDTERRSVGETTEGARSESVTFPEQIKEAFDRGSGERTSNDGALTPETLADLLHDEANLSALRRLVEQHPPDLVVAALTETLAVPDERIRKSRGAYFTAALRRRSTGRREGAAFP